MDKPTGGRGDCTLSLIQRDSVIDPLRGQFFKQLLSGPILLKLGMVFIHIVGHGNQENLGLYLFASTKQELSKTAILLYNAKGSPRLN